ncbi:MAG: hypothetical protein EA392_13660 [Cryomorphaceae bacterium]|nr:MAG: hypothetical protein EA392_13660 [Cryomorphaceae bacterium]
MKTITAEELREKLLSGSPVQVIDLREAYERDICSLNSEHIPLGDLLTQLHQLRRDVPVVLHCKGGDRAKAAVAALHQKHGFDNVYNLEGGIMAWAERIDPLMEKY